MKTVKIIGLCLVAVFAFSALAASSASATELLLSAATSTFSGSGGVSTLETLGGTTVKCTASTFSGSGTTAHLGTLSILFTTCISSIFICTGVNDQAGSKMITVGGELHLNLASTVAGGTPHSAILVLVNPVSFNCGGVIIQVQGNVIGLLRKADGVTPLVPPENLVNGTIVFKKSGTGMQDDKVFLLALTAPENEVMTAKLESKTGGGAFEESSQEGTATITSTTAGLHLVTG